jgi:hypothetical protein
MGGGRAERAGDQPQHVESEQIFIRFEIAEHLPGNLGVIEEIPGAIRECIQGKPQPLATPSDDPHQRHVFRHPVIFLNRRPQRNRCPLIFHLSQIAQNRHIILNGRRGVKPNRSPELFFGGELEKPPMVFSAVRRGIFVAKTTKDNSSSVGATSAGNMPLLRS